MPDWATFAVATVALTLLLLYVTRRSRRTLERVRIVNSRSDIAVAAGSDAGSGHRNDLATGPAASDDGSAASDDGPSAIDTGYDPATIGDHGPTDEQPTADPPTPPNRDEPVLTTTLLLVNAAVSQALALAVLVAIAWWTAVPASAFGIVGEHVVLGSSAVPSLAVPSLRSPAPATAIGLGVIAGVALYVGNEVVAGLGARFGASVPDRLRKAMAPGNAREWTLLFGVVLPVIAVFEEALFRGALIGAFAVGLAVDPWLLAVGSSVAFGLGHGAQGRLGIVVTGLLGLVLAALFVVSGSLLLVIVAHYVVNASEFAVREGLDLEPVSIGA